MTRERLAQLLGKDAEVWEADRPAERDRDPTLDVFEVDAELGLGTLMSLIDEGLVKVQASSNNADSCWLTLEFR